MKFLSSGHATWHSVQRGFSDVAFGKKWWIVILHRKTRVATYMRQFMRNLNLITNQLRSVKCTFWRIDDFSSTGLPLPIGALLLDPSLILNLQAWKLTVTDFLRVPWRTKLGLLLLLRGLLLLLGRLLELKLQWHRCGTLLDLLVFDEFEARCFPTSLYYVKVVANVLVSEEKRSNH